MTWGAANHTAAESAEDVLQRIWAPAFRHSECRCVRSLYFVFLMTLAHPVAFVIDHRFAVFLAERSFLRLGQDFQKQFGRPAQT